MSVTSRGRANQINVMIMLWLPDESSRAFDGSSYVLPLLLLNHSESCAERVGYNVTVVQEVVLVASIGTVRSWHSAWQSGGRAQIHRHESPM